MTNPEVAQMMQRYEQLYHETEDNNDIPLNKEKIIERVDLYYRLRRYHGLELDTRTNPWSWVTITPEEEEN